MIDNTLDSLDFTDWIWGFQLNLSSIIIPKNLVAATRGNTTLLIFNANSFNIRRSTAEQHVICFPQI